MEIIIMVIGQYKKIKEIMSSALNLKVTVLSFIEGNKYDLSLSLHFSSYHSDINSSANIILFPVMIIEATAAVITNSNNNSN